MSKNILKLVSGNKNKVREVQDLLSQSTNLKIEALDIDLPELQGDPEDVSKMKTKHAVDLLGCGPVITEDTSLCFNAWGGLPGVYIKWFLTKLGPDGISKVLNGQEDRTAYAQTIFAYCEGPGKDVLLFTGRTHGQIVATPRGARDFGWDPCFLPDGSDMTYGEMTKDQKNAVSHRAKALQSLVEYLEKTA